MVIDLSINQVFNPPIKAWFRDSDTEDWVENGLEVINHSSQIYRPYTTSSFHTYKYCTLNDPFVGEVIDLNKSQIISPPVHIWARNSESEAWEYVQLLAIDTRRAEPYICEFYSYAHCSLEEPLVSIDVDTSGIDTIEVFNVTKNKASYILPTLGSCELYFKKDRRVLLIKIKGDK